MATGCWKADAAGKTAKRARMVALGVFIFSLILCSIDAGVKQKCDSRYQLSVNVALMSMELHQSFFRYESEKNFSSGQLVRQKQKIQKDLRWCFFDRVMSCENRWMGGVAEMQYVRNCLRQSIPRGRACFVKYVNFAKFESLCGCESSLVYQRHDVWHTDESSLSLYVCLCDTIDIVSM